MSAFFSKFSKAVTVLKYTTFSEIYGLQEYTLCSFLYSIYTSEFNDSNDGSGC